MWTFTITVQYIQIYQDLKRIKALKLEHSTINHTQMLEELKLHQQQSIQHITNAFQQNK